MPNKNLPQAIFAVCTTLAIFSSSQAAQWECVDSTHTYRTSQPVLGDDCKIVDSIGDLPKKARRGNNKRPKGGVYIGMTWSDVVENGWGYPTRVNTTITAKGRREQWVYESGNYLYFENGMLTTIQK